MAPIVSTNSRLQGLVLCPGQSWKPGDLGSCSPSRGVQSSPPDLHHKRLLPSPTGSRVRVWKPRELLGHCSLGPCSLQGLRGHRTPTGQVLSSGDRGRQTAAAPTSCLLHKVLLKHRWACPSVHVASDRCAPICTEAELTGFAKPQILLSHPGGEIPPSPDLEQQWRTV